LEPLDSVFLDAQLKDDIVERCAIPDLLEAKVETGYAGTILYGEPGTGKTVLLEAIAQVYERAGAYVARVSTANIISKWLGSSAKKMEEILKKAVSEAKKRNLPSYIMLDEGEAVVAKAEDGARSTAKAYQGIINVLKRYIGNERSIVLGIATNSRPDGLEAAMTRNGRLTTFYVGPPKVEQIAQMWQYFTKEYIGVEMDMERSMELASISEQRPGAFIEEFCRNYDAAIRRKLLSDHGHSTLIDALKSGYRPSDEERQTFKSYEHIKSNLQSLVSRDQAENDGEGQKQIGFKRN